MPSASTISLTRYLIEERGHHRLTIDPAAANERAIRAYEKAGFRRDRLADTPGGPTLLMVREP